MVKDILCPNDKYLIILAFNLILTLLVNDGIIVLTLTVSIYFNKLTYLVMIGGFILAKEKNTDLNAEDSKKKNILNAAIAEFSHGYEKASTDAIVKSAGVSKGLLFHYFGTKKDLFIATYNYAVNAMMSEFFDLVNFDQRDILERWRQVVFLKMDLMKKHPMIFTFASTAQFPGNNEVKHNIVEQQNKILNAESPKLFSNIDRSLFREDIDVDMALRVIFFTMTGYSESQAEPEKTTEEYYGEYERYLREVERYIRFFKNNFYKEKGK